MTDTASNNLSPHDQPAWVLGALIAVVVVVAVSYALEKQSKDKAFTGEIVSLNDCDGFREFAGAAYDVVFDGEVDPSLSRTALMKKHQDISAYVFSHVGKPQFILQYLEFGLLRELSFYPIGHRTRAEFSTHVGQMCDTGYFHYIANSGGAQVRSVASIPWELK